MSNFFFYKAYGLGIVSSIAFPELISEKTYADVIIRIDSEETFSKGMVPMTKNNKLHTIQNSPQDISFLWKTNLFLELNMAKKL
ncbi:MAG: hypothetical protein K8E24_004170 [Methanobacterium paludis]|nr:hypothetical protein [Methanobacterium paludis]